MTSSLHSSVVFEADMSSVVAARATEKRKHHENDELDWQCIPLVVKTYDAWGSEAIGVFSTVAS